MLHYLNSETLARGYVQAYFRMAKGADSPEVYYVAPTKFCGLAEATNLLGRALPDHWNVLDLEPKGIRGRTLNNGSLFVFSPTLMQGLSDHQHVVLTEILKRSLRNQMDYMFFGQGARNVCRGLMEPIAHEICGIETTNSTAGLDGYTASRVLEQYRSPPNDLKRNIWLEPDVGDLNANVILLFVERVRQINPNLKIYSSLNLQWYATEHRLGQM